MSSRKREALGSPAESGAGTGNGAPPATELAPTAFGTGDLIQLLLGTGTRDQPAALRLSSREVVVGVGLAGTSGLALLAYAFAAIPMSFTVTFVALPATMALAGLILFRHQLYYELHVLAERLWRGAVWGLAGTIAYDLVRPVIVSLFHFSFSPFGAIPAFGQFMTGLPVTDPLAITLGWLYHFWNGISFGMMFAVVRPRGGPLAGILWGGGLQVLMNATYPQLLMAIRVNTPGFVATGLIGHSFWGAVLGAGLRGDLGRRLRARAPTAGASHPERTARP